MRLNSKLKIIAAASFEEQKYYISKKFSPLPAEIKEEIRVLCVITAQKLACTFIIAFDEVGDVYFQTLPQKEAFAFDEIGAELSIKQLSKTKQELLLCLNAWIVGANLCGRQSAM